MRGTRQARAPTSEVASVAGDAEARCGCGPQHTMTMERRDRTCRSLLSEKIHAVWRLLKHFCLRIDVCWSFFFFLLLILVSVTTVPLTQHLVLRSLESSLHDLHNIRVTSALNALESVNDRAKSVADSYYSIHLLHPLRINTAKSLATVCATLANIQDEQLNRLFLYSLHALEVAGCMRGAVANDSPAILGGYASQHHFVNGTYLVDNRTYALAQPLQLLAEWPAELKNISQTIPYFFGSAPILEKARAYYNGSINYIDPRLFWMLPETIPHLFWYLVPLGVIARGMPFQQDQHVDDLMLVGFDGAELLSSFGSPASGFSAAAFVNASFFYKDQLIFSNNWGQKSKHNVNVFIPPLNTTASYVTAESVSDTLMRAAIKHVNLKGMQTVGYNETVSFVYGGAYAVVTAISHMTDGGLVIPLVLASGHGFITLPYLTIAHITYVVSVVATVLFTALFWWLVHNEYSQPLERMTALLLDSLRTGKRAVMRATRHTCVQLRESAALIHAFNDAMQRLREIDTFVPRNLRQRLLRRQQQQQSEATMSHDSRRDPSPRVETQRRSSSRRGTLLRHHLTLVCVVIRAHGAGAEAASAALLADAGDTASGSAMRRGQRLAAVVERAAHAGRVGNNGPFPSADALTAFSTAVHELAELHHGVVRQLTPDQCSVYFAKCVRSHLPRHCSAQPAPPAHDTQKLQPHIDHDARDALAFALALQQWVERHAAPPQGPAAMPDVRVLVDTGVFVCGQYRAACSEQTLSVALGRDVVRELGCVPAKIGVRVAMTEETALRVRGGGVLAGVRQLPVEALRTGRAGLDADVVILYEALPGAASCDAAWLRYSRCCFDGFECMVRGDYAAALRAYKEVAAIADLEPGLMPRSLRREAAHSNVTGGAVSTQVERLMRECEQRVAAGEHGGYWRGHRSPYGIDTVLRNVPLAQRLSATSHASPLQSPVSPAPLTGTAPNTPALHATRRRAQVPRSALRVMHTADTVRHVVVVRTVHGDVRCVLGSKPQEVRDNLGTSWRLPRNKMEETPTVSFLAHYVALGSAGSMCSAGFLPFRELQPVVAKAIAGAPCGPMSNELRSAVPICDATPQQRRAVEELFPGRRHLQHPNLLNYGAYSLSVEGGVMVLKSFASAGTLREVLSRYPTPRTAALKHFMLGILSALAYLHSNGCVHGSVSLDTATVGGDGLCRMRSFFVNYRLAQRTFLLPCTCYVSPAMAAGQVPTPACDMFCYGLLALEALSGQRPWSWASQQSPGAGGTSEHSDEELAALMAGGGQPFCEAVLAGRVVPALQLLDLPAVRDHASEQDLNDVRRCLSLDPAGRPSAVDMLHVAQECIRQSGMRLEEEHESHHLQREATR